MNARVGFYLAVIFVVGVLFWGLVVDKYFPLAFGLAVIGLGIALQIAQQEWPDAVRRGSDDDDHRNYRNESPSFDHLPSNRWYDGD